MYEHETSGAQQLCCVKLKQQNWKTKIQFVVYFTADTDWIRLEEGAGPTLEARDDNKKRNVKVEPSGAVRRHCSSFLFKIVHRI